MTSAASRDHGARALVSAASSLPTHRDGTSERLCREPTPRRIAPRDASSTRAGFDRVGHRVAAFATRAPRPPSRRVSTRIDSPPRDSFPSVIARFAFPSAQDDAKLAEAIAQINEKRPDLPFFEPDDVIIEWDQCLGEGGFCTAYRAVWGGAHARDARRWLLARSAREKTHTESHTRVSNVPSPLTKNPRTFSCSLRRRGGVRARRGHDPRVVRGGGGGHGRRYARSRSLDAFPADARVPDDSETAARRNADSDPRSRLFRRWEKLPARFFFAILFQSGNRRNAV